jgi:class 3 adenylate cyclase
MFALGWLGGHLGSIDPSDVNAIATAFSKLKSPVMLLLQPVAWAAGAALAGYVRRLLAGRIGAVRASIAGAAAGVALLAGGTVVAYSSAGLAAPSGQIMLAAAESAVLALAFAAMWEAFFPLTPVVAPGKGTFNRPASVATEDADVDELLRLIANAEDKLTTEHTTNAVVMITDMKSFSKMTEEDGSILTAKAIQRHRDLLLPLIESHGGHGKSTGGDGLIAAFGGPSEALVAASELQRALATYNSTHPDERDMLVRIGIAQGEVVLDKGGRPFIGAALNMAARVMNLADGGQTFCTGYIASSAREANVETASHGTFELKNIAKPIEVFEVLWYDGQEPFLPAAQQ